MPDNVEARVAAGRALEDIAYHARPDDDGRIALSTAISLKRIADAMEALKGGEGPTWLNGLEDLAWSMGQAFARGQSAG